MLCSHIDPEFPGVAGGGFRAPILHGLCTMGHTIRQVFKEYCGNDASKFKACAVRFSSPVIPGETLVTKMWKDGDRVAFIAEVKETGKVCISNAYLLRQIFLLIRPPFRSRDICPGAGIWTLAHRRSSETSMSKCIGVAPA